MVVRGRLADDGGDHPSEAAEFNAEDAVNGLREVPPTRKGTSPAGFVETVISRHGRFGATNETFVSDVDGRHSIHPSEGQGGLVIFPLSGCEVIFPADRVDKDVDWFGEGRPVLNIVVAHHAEYSSLGEDCDLVIE